MFNKIKAWTARRDEIRRKKEFIRGYNWAAGSLLRKDETPVSITSCMYKSMWTIFDSGAIAAIEKLIDAKVIEDDRISERPR